jgi:hypothetical protein
MSLESANFFKLERCLPLLVADRGEATEVQPVREAAEVVDKQAPRCGSRPLRPTAALAAATRHDNSSGNLDTFPVRQRSYTVQHARLRGE